MNELRGNWEPERNILGWTRSHEERTCRFCRRSRMHTKAEHDLVYPTDRATQLAHDRAEEDRQLEADHKLLAQYRAEGMTEDEAEDALWRAMWWGEGLVEPIPRPYP